MNAPNVTVNLVPPGTLYGDRTNQIDFRLAKILKFGRTRTQVGLDVYNALNSSAVLGYNQAYILNGAWLTPNSVITGRFAKIGIPAPEILGPFVGACETIGGGLLILGLITRFAALVLLIDISVAIVSTKIPILLGHGYGRFALPNLPRYGFLSMMHEARTDFSMWLGLLFLLIVGAGKISFDAILARSR